MEYWPARHGLRRHGPGVRAAQHTAACRAVHDSARNWNELGSVLHPWEHTELSANLP